MESMVIYGDLWKKNDHFSDGDMLILNGDLMGWSFLSYGSHIRNMAIFQMVMLIFNGDLM